MQKQKTVQNPMAELGSRVSKAAMLIELYEKHANSGIRDEGELGQVQREMKAIKNEILSELVRSRALLQQIQGETKAV